MVVGDTPIERVSSAKLLGITISADLRWNAHIDDIIARASKRVFLLWHLKRSGVARDDLIVIYTTTVRPVLEYACPVWHSSLPDYLHNSIERVQRRAIYIIYGKCD